MNRLTSARIALMRGAAVAMLLPSATASADPDEDFAQRASHPDVVFAEGFDDEAAVVDKRLPDGNEGSVTWTQAQAASGAGSMQFEIPSNSYANGGGNWRTNFADDNYSIKFRSGDHLYVQWRQRFSADFLGTVFETQQGGSGGWKQVIIGEGDYEGWNYGDANEATSCTPLEVVVNDGSQKTFPQIYHNCGDYWPYSEPFSSEYNNNDFLQQNAIFNPRGTSDRERYVLWSQMPSRNRTLPEHFPGMGYHADEWMTFQVRISPGPLGIADDPLIGGQSWGFTDSTIQMWVARDGEPAVLTHSFEGVVLQRGDGDQDTDEAYGKIWLTPYHTDKDAAQTHPVGYTWYDELIVSRSRIADPGFPSTGDTGGDGTDSEGESSGDGASTTSGGSSDTAGDSEQPATSASAGSSTAASGSADPSADGSGCACAAGRDRRSAGFAFAVGLLGLVWLRRWG